MSEGNPPLLITEEHFAAALEAAAAMDLETLKKAAGAGHSRSYFVRNDARVLPLKAVLKLAYRRAGVDWNYVQSARAARELRTSFDIVHDPDASSEDIPDTGRVYIANFGEANVLWPTAKANSSVLTIDNVNVHPFWRAGDRQGYIAAAQESNFTARGVRPTKQTAGRWFNLIEELRDTEGDIWISRQGASIWWTVSEPGEMQEELIPSTNPARDGPQVWLLQKPCRPWSDRDASGRPLLWEALHAKARDFLSTEATFQSIANDRGYADYARALVAGEPLDPWHQTKLFRDKADASTKSAGRTFSAKETAAMDMTRTLLATVSQSNGQSAERRVKEKNTDLSREEWEALLLRMLGEQEDHCALTGLPLGYVGESDDLQMRPSLDRIDSSGHYTADNVQIVCRFINRWKGADNDEMVRRLLGVLRGS